MKHKNLGGGYFLDGPNLEYKKTGTCDQKCFQRNVIHFCGCHICYSLSNLGFNSYEGSIVYTTHDPPLTISVLNSYKLPFSALIHRKVSLQVSLMYILRWTWRAIGLSTTTYVEIYNDKMTCWVV